MKPTSENGCRRFRAATFLIAVLLSLSFMPQASWADLYSGSLNAGADGGLVGTEPWNAASTVLSWGITYEQQADNKWIYTYKYTFSVPEKDISHVIIQVSDSFTKENVLEGTTEYWALGTYSSTDGNSNPGMLGSYLGLKWNTEEVLGKDAKATNFTWIIVTNRAPMLGSFYAKDGKDSGNWVYAYADGNVSVPDSTSTVPSPLPPCCWAPGLLGLLGVKAGLFRVRGRVSRKRNPPSQASY